MLERKDNTVATGCRGTHKTVEQHTTIATMSMSRASGPSRRSEPNVGFTGRSLDLGTSRHSEPHLQVRVPTLRSIKMRDKDKASVSSRSKDSSRDGGSSQRSLTSRWHKTSKDERSSYKSSECWSKPAVQYQNTYRLEPMAKFKPGAAQEVMSKILAEHLDGVQYDGQLMGFKTKVVSDAIKESVKKLEVPRFKLVTWVMICEKTGNDIRAASRGLWDNACDSYTSVRYENQTILALANVYAIYQE